MWDIQKKGKTTIFVKTRCDRTNYKHNILNPEMNGIYVSLRINYIFMILPQLMTILL